MSRPSVTSSIGDLAARTEAGRLGAFASAAGEVLRRIDHTDFYSALQRSLATLVSFDNFIVYRYRDGVSAELAHTNLDFDKLAADMQQYSRGLYLLDPFYLASRGGHPRGIATIAEVAPEGFRESEFYRLHYLNVNVVDEVRFLVEVGIGDFVHVFVEREPPHQSFASDELHLLEEVQLFVRSAVEKHCSWRGMSDSVSSGARGPAAIGLRSVIQGLQGGTLTAREVDIVELSVKGHSAKSIAHVLRISEGTVINHKRNLYAKLGVNSQAQLFHLFLRALYCEPGAPRPAPGDA